jgi:ParB-like chromosome segregation protein Spo0J
MNKQTVKIACSGADFLSLEEMSPFQDEIKYLHKEDYESLKNSILSEGFSEPIGIWKNKGKNNILSGHQRHFALKKMQEEGIVVPKLPVSYIECKDEKEAKKKILELASVYGRFDKEKLKEFIKANELKIEDIQLDLRLPDVNLSELIASLAPIEDVDPFDLSDLVETTVPKQDSETSLSHSEVKLLQLYYDKNEHIMILDMLSTLSERYQKDNISDTVLACIKEIYENNSYR